MRPWGSNCGSRPFRDGKDVSLAVVDGIEEKIPAKNTLTVAYPLAFFKRRTGGVRTAGNPSDDLYFCIEMLNKAQAGVAFSIRKRSHLRQSVHYTFKGFSASLSVHLS